MSSEAPPEAASTPDPEPGRSDSKAWLLPLAAVGVLAVIGAINYRGVRQLLTRATRKEKGMAEQSQSAKPPTGQEPVAQGQRVQLEPVEFTVRHAPARAPATATDTGGKTLGYEPHDVNTRGVLMAAIALFVMVGAGLFVVRGLLNGFNARQPPETPITLVQPQTTPIVPELWFAPAANTQTYLGQEATQLDSYGWVDEANGVAHIPITQAMQLVVEQGLPARDQAPPSFGVYPPYQLDSEGGAPSQ